MAFLTVALPLSLFRDGCAKNIRNCTQAKRLDSLHLSFDLNFAGRSVLFEVVTNIFSVECASDEVFTHN